MTTLRIVIRHLIPALQAIDADLARQPEQSASVTDGSQLHTVKQVAERMQCSESHVHQLCERYELGHYRHGRFLRISETHLQRYLATLASDRRQLRFEDAS